MVACDFVIFLEMQEWHPGYLGVDCLDFGGQLGGVQGFGCEVFAGHVHCIRRYSLYLYSRWLYICIRHNQMLAAYRAQHGGEAATGDAPLPYAV